MLPTLLCRHKQFVFALCHTRSNRESHPTQVRYCPCVVVVVLRPIVKEVQENGLLRLTQSDADRDVVKRDYFPQTGSIINGLVSRQNNFFGVGMLGFGMWILGLRRKNRDMGRRFQLETPYTICVKISQLQNESPRSRSLNISSRGKHANNLPREQNTLSALTIKYLENAYRCCGYKGRICCLKLI